MPRHEDKDATVTIETAKRRSPALPGLCCAFTSTAGRPEDKIMTRRVEAMKKKPPAPL